MAAISASSFVTVAAASAAPQPACCAQKLSVARFNGLKAFPSFRQRTTICRPVAVRRLVISAVTAEKATLEKVQGIIVDQLACEEEKVVPEAKFAELGADSLDTVEIMMALEEEFKITIEEDSAGKISTVQEAADLIQEVLASKPKP